MHFIPTFSSCSLVLYIFCILFYDRFSSSINAFLLHIVMYTILYYIESMFHFSYQNGIFLAFFFFYHFCHFFMPLFWKILVSTLLVPLQIPFLSKTSGGHLHRILLDCFWSSLSKCWIIVCSRFSKIVVRTIADESHQIHTKSCGSSSRLRSFHHKNFRNICWLSGTMTW